MRSNATLRQILTNRWRTFGDIRFWGPQAHSLYLYFLMLSKHSWEWNSKPEVHSCFKTISLKYTCIPMKRCAKFWKQLVKNFRRFKIMGAPIGLWRRHLTHLYGKGNLYTKFGISKAVSFFVYRRPIFRQWQQKLFS